MLLLLRTIQTVLLILVIGAGTWVEPALADSSLDEWSSDGQESESSAVVSDLGSEEKPSGESNDGDGEGEGSQDGKLHGLHAPRLEWSAGPHESDGRRNEELPLRGRETIRELFRPPRS
jgi:hypothetical protein